MRRALTLAVLAAFVWAAPASADLAPAPTVERFDGETVDANTFISQCPESIVRSGGRDGGPFLRIACGSTGSTQVRIVLRAPQTMVELFVRTPQGSTGPLDVDACGPMLCDGTLIDTVRISPAPAGWTPVILVNNTGSATIESVLVSAPGSVALDLDDVAYSTTFQPDTEIVSGPAATTTDGAATFTFRSNVTASFRCALDAQVDFTPCPATFTGFAPGAHRLRVAAADEYGAIDLRSPARYDWTVVAPSPDRDADRIPDATDNCPDKANSDQADGDKDGVGDACEQLPRGDLPPVAGVNAVVKLLSGEVFVKLPAHTPLGFRGLRAPFQDTGFVPLKGVASLPVGSTVDARKGELSVQAAANGYAPSNRKAREQTARIRAGIFAIKQARLKKKAKKSASIPTDIGLVSASGAEATCARASAKGVVRSLSMVAKGDFRALGGAATATARSATFATTDRCDGTLTEVGAGKVTIAVKGRKAPVTVKAGGAYFAKARLFAAKKGRRS